VNYENIADPVVQEKLRQSKLKAEKLVKREIRCPRCGFYLMDVYGYGHYITRVKCRKCKFDEVIDTGLFRTMRHQKRYQYSKYKSRI
jgi:phage FluMu protein Com